MQVNIPCGKSIPMTTNDAITTPLSAPIPPPDFTSIPLFYSTMAIKMAGHAVAGVLLHRRPRAVSLDPRNGAWGSYRLDPREAQGESAAMVAIAGHAALTIAEMMNEALAKGFKESALCTDLYLAFRGLPGDALSREARVLSLLPRVHELLLARWPTVKAVAAHLLTHRQIDGSTLGRVVRPRPENPAAASR